MTRHGVSHFLRSGLGEKALEQLGLEQEERDIILEGCALLGGFDAGTQSAGLERAADRLQRRSEQLAGKGMSEAKVRQAMLAAASLVAALLLI